MVLREFADPDGAAACYRQSLAIEPNDPVTHSNLLYAMHYQVNVSREAMHAEHLAWATRHAEPLYREIKPHKNNREPGRRLRIAYISADFREHPRARFIEPLLSRHNRKQFEIYCYDDAGHPDDQTKRFRKMADVWREVAGMADNDLAELIRRDAIDLLIDCTGHMAHHRLLVLARKPAPVQILYPGYPNTSGLKTIDYWITDSYQDPPGMTDRFRTEKIVRLKPFARCYTASEKSPDPGPLPAASNGFITFGALNNPVKNNANVLAVWNRIFSALPNARLLLLVGQGAEEVIGTAFARSGIPRDRLEIVSRVKRDKYLALFQRIDILLDPFPYNGYTTTLDSLWMGVPVLTLAGDTNVSRAGVSLLSNVGLPEWVAQSQDDYVDRGVRFGNDIGALGKMRRVLREQMIGSPLMDARNFLQEIETAYRDMWNRWCASPPNPA
jgi:predicted O-linked N-acetylglucosamine transferase (SPINDLY family)